MNIILYEFSKRANSTKIPSSGTQATGTFKTPYDLVHPVFEIERSTLGSKNYISTVMFHNRTWYYKIDSIVYRNNIIAECACTLDILATFKDTITGNNYFVERASDQTKQTDYLQDNIYTPVNEVKTGSVSQGLITSSGFYVVGLITNSLPHVTFIRGMVQYVLMNPSAFMMFTDNMMNVCGIDNDMNPLQYVVSVVFIPFSLPEAYSHTEEQSIYLGMGSGNAIQIHYSYSDDAQPFLSGIISTSKTLKVPVHIDASRYGKYMCSSPWESAVAFIPGIGDVDLPLEQFNYASNGKAVSFRVTTDLATGASVCDIKNSLGDLIMRVEGSCGIQIEIAQISRASALGIAQSVISAGVSIATANVVGAAANIGNAFESFIPRTSSKGSNGSFAMLDNTNIVITYCMARPDGIDTEHYGYPVMKVMKPNTCSIGSYIKTRNAKPVIAVPSDILEMMSNAMDNGFYYE